MICNDGCHHVGWNLNKHKNYSVRFIVIYQNKPRLALLFMVVQSLYPWMFKILQSHNFNLPLPWKPYFSWYVNLAFINNAIYVAWAVISLKKQLNGWLMHLLSIDLIPAIRYRTSKLYVLKLQSVWSRCVSYSHYITFKFCLTTYCLLVRWLGNNWLKTILIPCTILSVLYLTNLQSF